MHNGIGGNGDIGAVSTGQLGDDGLSAYGGDDHVVLAINHLRGDPGVHDHPDVPLGHLGDEVVLIVLQRPLEGDVVGVTDGTAQLVGGLKDG